MIEYKYKKIKGHEQKKFTENGHTMFESDVLKRLKRLADLEEQLKQGELLPMHLVMTRLMSKNVIFNEAVSFAECNKSRDFEDTKATFIGGVHWLKGYLQSNES